MILLISTCEQKLSELEFVKPIKEILKKECFIRHYSKISKRDLEKAEKIIICGTALKDFEYLENLDKFNWLRETNKPVLGICAGFQILTVLFKEKLIDKRKLGQFNVETIKRNPLTKQKFKSYFLSSKIIINPKNFDVLAKSKEDIAVIKHKSKKIYAILFHPEVMNEEIIINFKNL